MVPSPRACRPVPTTWCCGPRHWPACGPVAATDQAPAPGLGDGGRLIRCGRDSAAVRGAAAHHGADAAGRRPAGLHGRAAALPDARPGRGCDPSGWPARAVAGAGQSGPAAGNPGGLSRADLSRQSGDAGGVAGFRRCRGTGRLAGHPAQRPGIPGARSGPGYRRGAGRAGGATGLPAGPDDRVGRHLLRHLSRTARRATQPPRSWRARAGGSLRPRRPMPPRTRPARAPDRRPCSPAPDHPHPEGALIPGRRAMARITGRVSLRSRKSSPSVLADPAPAPP
jgi:hypothetical protein